MAQLNLGNARDPEQLEKMKELQAKDVCFFCEEGFFLHKSPILLNTIYWYIKTNDYPNVVETSHYLIVIKRHVVDAINIKPDEWSELGKMIIWLQNLTEAPGFSIYLRSGDMNYTSGSIDHLHFHFLKGIQKGENTEKIRIPLGYKKSPGT